MASCIEWAEDRTQECAQTEDQGFTDCATQMDLGFQQCCDWWPCSWFCQAWVWVSNVVCVAWTWVSNIVCIAWTWVTTAVCVAWDVVTTVVNAIIVTIESTLGYILNALAVVLEALEMTPVLGALIRWVLNGITYVVGIIGSLGDAFLGWIGIRPEKLLRVCTVILRDENGTEVADTRDVVAMLQLAVDVYYRDANVRIMPLRPFKYSTGFDGPESVDESWVRIDEANSDAELLDPRDSFANDWLMPGSRFQRKMTLLCFHGAFRRIIGYGAPITVFIVRDTQPDALGRALGITDYVFVDGMASDPAHLRYSPRTIGHEIGHSCTLLHTCVDDGNDNIMATQTQCNPDSITLEDRINPVLSDDQAIIIRMSKHITYF